MRHSDAEYAQLSLFGRKKDQDLLDPAMWRGSFNNRESTLQQLSPYVGKIKSGMAKALISVFSEPGDTVLDPFSGSGVVPLESALMKRKALANDLSPYAYVLTRGKLQAPAQYETAFRKARELVSIVARESSDVDVSSIPDWVQSFFHPKTLQEIVVAFRELEKRQDHFLTACLLGILHHVRPGFLSFPASHLVPYLRESKYPRNEFPEMYQYRDLGSRLLAKVKRAYRRAMLPMNWDDREYHVFKSNAMDLPIESDTVDAIISSPPYFGALDYARDNRLRLWFLGCQDWKNLDQSLTANSKVYLAQMGICLQEMHRVLKPGAKCALVLGDVDRNGKLRNTAGILADLAQDTTQNGLVMEAIYDDRIPDDRRSRRGTQTTKFERILVMSKL